MFTAITTGLVVLIVVAAFLFIARRVLRLALKLALAGMIVLLLIVGVAVGWWRGWFGPASPRTVRPSSPPTAPSNSKRHPSSP